ncbi:MAG: tetratricopeptide repeat protein [Myxococcota bacterium]
MRLVRHGRARHRHSGPVPRQLLGYILIWLMWAPFTGKAEVSEAQRGAVGEIRSTSSVSRFYAEALSEERKGQLARARQTLEMAVAVAESEKDARTQAILLERMAILMEKMGQPITARNRLEKACELRGKARDDFGELVCLEQLGPKYLAALNASRAESTYQRLKKLAKKYDDALLEAQCYLGLGQAAVVGQRAGVARRELDKALSAFNALGRSEDVAQVYRAQAELARLSDDHQSSYKLNLMAQELLPDDTRTAIALIEDALILGQHEEVQRRIARLPLSSLTPVQQVELSFVSLVIYLADKNIQGLTRSSLQLHGQFLAIPKTDDAPIGTEPLRRYLKKEARITDTSRETLAGILVILGAERTSVTELALKKQLELLVSQAKE